MSTTSQPYRLYGEGQIALEQALFCLECELIFAGTVHCPRCADQAVWPLNQWVPSSRPSASILPNPKAGRAAHGLEIVYLNDGFSKR
jgi:hypothetical protein